MPGRLDGVRAIVTGGAAGEGLSAAEGMLREGARVSIWDENPTELDRARAELEGQHLKPDVQQLILSDWDQVQRAYGVAKAALGGVDLLLCNATLKNAFMMGPENQHPYKPVAFWDLNLDRFRKTLDVNVMGAYLALRAVAPDMVAQRRGSIVMVSTQDHTKRSADHIPYGPSKALVETLSLGAAEQLEPHGVRINVVQAGGRVQRRGQPLEPGNQPHDVMVPMLIYLATDVSKEVTGQVFTPDRFKEVISQY